jgi:hypothetical protein
MVKFKCPNPFSLAADKQHSQIKHKVTAAIKSKFEEKGISIELNTEICSSCRSRIYDKNFVISAPLNPDSEPLSSLGSTTDAAFISVGSSVSNDYHFSVAVSCILYDKHLK